MIARTREKLREFLFLDARSDGTVPTRDIERQEDTVLRALSLLDEQPGVVLADEVGMGKTFEALGVIAARMQERPEARTLILTPGPDLSTKWEKELHAFGDRARPMYKGFVGKFCKARTLAEMARGLRTHQIVIASISAFAGSRSNADLAYLLSLWGHARDLTGGRLAAVLRRYRDDTLESVDVTESSFLDTFTWDHVEPVLAAALGDHSSSKGEGSLDGLLRAGRYEAFSDHTAVDAALSDFRFYLLQKLLPPLDLLVVDEAHKLKNAESVRVTGVRRVFEKKFDKVLFLTATPFQLTVKELRQVFKLFALATTAPADLLEKARRLIDDVEDYTHAYEELDRVWSLLDGVGASDFSTWFANDPGLTIEPSDPTMRKIVLHARRLLDLKRTRIEPGFRKWMIRSLREDKRTYRRATRHRLRPEGGGAIPFVLYERFIDELFLVSEPTHKSAVQINMVSSFNAAREGDLLSDGGKMRFAKSAEDYRRLLQNVLGHLRESQGSHPKIEHVTRDAMEAAAAGEKTLIFCARRESVRALKNEIESRWNEHMLQAWQRVYPGAAMGDVFDEVIDDARVRGRHTRLQARFTRGQDALYLGLRERYVITLLDAAEFAAEHIGEIVRRANEILQRQRLPRAHAERIDWSVAKRCVEQATALTMKDEARDEHVDPDAMRRILDPKFVSLGLDLEADDVESASEGNSIALWKIGEDEARLVTAPMHLWAHLTGFLAEVPAELRVRTVEQLARYLVSRYVPFLPDLLAYAKSKGLDCETIEARTLLPVVDSFWMTPLGRPWSDLIRNFLVYAMGLDEERRKVVMDDVVRAGAIVRHTVDGESRELLREAFNTPLYPMILVANEVMQEGLDLHHHCRRVVHHDLAWNPAQLEQRVGRVDRLGSLVQRRRIKVPETKLEVSLPVIANTIDERLERTVRLRERWLEFLLGAAPRMEEYGLSDEPAQPLPAAFADALRIELGPIEPSVTES